MKDMMTKMAVALMALVMMATIGAGAEQAAVTKHFVEGKVIEVYEDGASFLLDDLVIGHVVVHVSEETNVLVGDDITAGDYLLVEFNGAMTMSLPGQLTATHITGYALEGLVLSIEKDGSAILINTATMGELMVNLPEGSAQVPVPGSYVRIAFNGIVAASMPGQVSAWAIESYVRFEGHVTEISEAGILVTAEDGSQMMAKIGDKTLQADEVEVGALVEVLYNGILTRSLPPQGNAIYLRLLTAGE